MNIFIEGLPARGVHTLTDTQGVKHFYDREAFTYDKTRWETRLGQYLNETHKCIVLRLVGAQSQVTWLDVGTGTGRFARALSSKGLNVIGIDISLYMLRGAHMFNNKLDRKAPFTLINGSTLQLPFADSSFSGVVMINVLSHLPEWPAALAEIYRVLQPGGRLIANIPNLQSPYFPYALLVNHRQMSIRRHVYTKWFRLPEVRKHFSSKGFEIIQVVGHFSFPSNYRADFLLPIIKLLDRAVRDSPLTLASPSLFLSATKTSIHSNRVAILKD